MIKVLSFNIRYDHEENNPENNWVNRKNDVFNAIMAEQPDLAGFQEVLPHIKNDFKVLPKGFIYGIPRDNGIDEGELNLIYVNEDVFEVLDKDTFWLSDTPTVPSKYKSSGCTRLASWVKVKHKKIKDEFYFVNTHIDNLCEDARLKQIAVLKSFLKDKQFILVGDFNSTDKDLEIKTIREDAIDVAASLNNAKGTYNDFNIELNHEDMDRIDFIFTSEEFSAKNYTTHTDKRKNGHYISDHFMISADIKF